MLHGSGDVDQHLTAYTILMYDIQMHVQHICVWSPHDVIYLVIYLSLSVNIYIYIYTWINIFICKLLLLIPISSFYEVARAPTEGGFPFLEWKNLTPWIQRGRIWTPCFWRGTFWTGLGRVEPDKDSLSQTNHKMCLTPQIGQHQLRLGIPLASQFPN